MHTKRISKGYGKKPRWLATPKPGAHSKEESIPLVLVVRDILGYADNAREAGFIINKGGVLVDKKVRKNLNFGVGLMDVIKLLKANKYFRILPAKKGVQLKEIDKKEAQFKLSKVMDKRILSKDKMQINLHDGSNLAVKKDEGEKIKTRGTLILELPSRKIKKEIEFKKGNMAMIVKGRHSGEVGEIKEIVPRTQTHRALTRVGEIQTLSKYIFMIGEEKKLISV